jgi:hypothetical protein
VAGKLGAEVMKRRVSTESHPALGEMLSAGDPEDALLEDCINRMVDPSGERVKTILVVESDLGFLFWLGYTLCGAGYMALPAKSCQNASELLSRLNVGIRLLIVNCSMPDAGAFAEELRRSHRELKVIALIGDGEEPGPVFPGANASQHKYSCLGEVSELEWLETIASVFAEDAADDQVLRSSIAKPS